MTTKLNDDILASTGNTAKEQEMFFAGVEAGEANAKNNAEVRGAPAAPVSTVEQDEQPARLTDGYWWPTTASQLKRVAAELIRAADAMGAADDDDEEADLILSVVPTGAICLDEDDPEGRNLHPVLAVSIADYADEGAYPVDPLDPTGGRPEEAPAAGDALATLQTLVDMYVCNQGGENEFITCIIPPGAASMTRKQRAKDEIWKAWDAARAILAAQRKGDA